MKNLMVIYYFLVSEMREKVKYSKSKSREKKDELLTFY